MKTGPLKLLPRYLSVLLLLIPVAVLAASKGPEKNKRIKVEFDVIYSLSERYVDPFVIEVFNITDSVPVKPERELWRDGKGVVILEAGKQYRATVAQISFGIETENGYGYDPKYDAEEIEIDLRNQDKKLTLEPVRIHKKMHKQLEEVTVKPSRILFYNKGDTLVFNASEFILAEGSTLDALIKQLPGVTLTQDAEILVNGRKVDDLLINGKDLFSGNRKIMLENIGAYTVKDIAVYEKNTMRNEVLGRDIDSKKYSMDVRLKREYSIGWSVNADAGYGYRNRYIGSLFGNWFSDNVSVSFNGSVRNLSDEYLYNSGNAGEMPAGIYTVKSGGLNYNAEGQANKWRISGSVNVSHSSGSSDQSTTVESFLPDGNNYQYSFSNNKSKNLYLNTSHYISIGFNRKAFINMSPSVYYTKNDQAGYSVSALFNEDIQNVTMSMLENIYHGFTNLTDSLVYRNIAENSAYNHTTDILLPLGISANIGSGVLELRASGKYNERGNNTYQLYLVNHSGNPVPTTRDFQQRKGRPDYSRQFKTDLSYNLDLDWYNSRLRAQYSFEHSKNVNTSNVSAVKDWEIPSDNYVITIADLLAMPGFTPVYSPDLSHRNRLFIDEHGLDISFSNYNPVKLNDKFGMYIYFAPIRFQFSDRDYRYEHGEEPILLRKHSFLPNSNLNIRIEEKKGYSFSLGYGLYSSNPAMQNMITLPQTDPLNVYYGNPDLKPSQYYNLYFNLQRQMNGQRLHSFRIDLSSRHNEVGRGYIFNTVTGVRYYYPFNIDGNKSGMMNYNFFTPFGKDNRFEFSTSTSFNISKNIDMIGTTVEAEDFIFDPSAQQRRYIQSISAGEHINFKYTFEKNSVSLFSNLQFNNYRSKDSGFTNFNSLTGRYGTSATFSLPFGFNLSTDFNIYSRSGFTDNRLNTSDLIWNAQLSKPLLKGSLLFTVMGFDMLHQLNNILYTVTPQARTEIVRNVVPAKVLFKVQYRFNKSPKR